MFPAHPIIYVAWNIRTYVLDFVGKSAPEFQKKPIFMRAMFPGRGGEGAVIILLNPGYHAPIIMQLCSNSDIYQ